MENKTEKVINYDINGHAANIFGDYDRNLRIIEDAFNVSILFRDNSIRVCGSHDDIKKTIEVIDKLMAISSGGDLITRQNVNYLINLAETDQLSKADEYLAEHICITSKGKKIKARTHGQQIYVNAIKDYDIVFGIGPAGTGKTFLAVAMAVNDFRNKSINRIILTRPAVEAGEKLGFLPGDLQDKVDPYLRPLYDSIHEIMGIENYQKFLERGMIEVAPLAYMRGRTLEDSFIILDEAQNTTPEQMKMFLTRIGTGSKAVITGDITQIDLPGDKQSGLKAVTHILKDVEGIEFIYLSDKDVVRHELVQRIIKAYEKWGNTDVSKKRQG